MVPAASVVAALARVLAQFASANPRGHKGIVFFPTARQTGFMAGLFAKMGFNVLEVRSTACGCGVVGGGVAGM